MSADGPTAEPRACRSLRAWLTLMLVLTLGLTIDLSTKYWTFATVAGQPVVLDRQALLADVDYSPIPLHHGRPALPWGLLDLQLVINRGAVFGLGENQRWFFILFTVVALGAGLIVFGRMTAARNNLAHMAIGLILAGGVGNLYDRIVYGVVRDFLHMLPDYHLPFGWRWGSGSPEIFPWVFNLADVMLLTGMGLLLVHMHRTDKLRKAEAAAEHASRPAETRSPRHGSAGSAETE